MGNYVWKMANRGYEVMPSAAIVGIATALTIGRTRHESLI